MESHTLAASVSQASVGGVMVSIVAFQARDPVRFPANAVFLFFILKPWLAKEHSYRVGFNSRSLQLFLLIPFYTGESSTGGYTVYVGLDLESGKTAVHSCVHGFCQ